VKIYEILKILKKFLYNPYSMCSTQRLLLVLYENHEKHFKANPRVVQTLYNCIFPICFHSLILSMFIKIDALNFVKFTVTLVMVQMVYNQNPSFVQLNNT